MSLKKVLLIAYSCEPGFSSEREVGWKWSQLLSEHCDLYVLTRKNNKPVIDKYIKERNISNRVKFIYYDLPKWAKFWKRGEKGLYLYYAIWQFFAILHCRKIHKTIRFDITHYLTFGSLLLPQFSFLMPTKYVLGPVGGGENVPRQFLSDFSFKGRLQICFRYFYQNIQRFNPIFIANCYKADAILARTPETLSLVPKQFHHKTDLCLETGTPEELISADTIDIGKNDIFTIVTVGRLIPTKVNILTLRTIKAFKEIYRKPFRFIVIGDGPEKSRLESYCKVHHLDEVEFLGWKNRDDVFRLVGKSDVYFSTTFKEGGTWAFFEAVALRIPVVCLKLCGPDLIVSDDGGIKVKPQAVEKTTISLAEGLHELALDPFKRDQLASCALNHIQTTLSWDSIVDKTIRKYSEVLEK